MNNIEGLPLGTKIKKLLAWGRIYQATLEPDNVYNVLDLTTVPIPEGYRRVEEDWFREPRKDELFLNSGNLVCKSVGAGLSRRIIVEPIPKVKKVLIVNSDWEYCLKSYVPYTIEERDA